MQKRLGNTGLAKVDSTEELLVEAQEYAKGSISKNSKKAYKVDFEMFSEWCKERELASLPASVATVAAYLSSLAKSHKVSTIKRKLASIAVAHTSAKLESPTRDENVKRVFRGIRRSKGQAVRRKAPALALHMKELATTLHDKPADIRDKALLFIGYTGSLRRSELVALDFEDLALCKEGLVVEVRKSKTDQYAFGRRIGICYGEHDETCPVKALIRWLKFAGITGGPLFRSISKSGRVLERRLNDKSVANIVKSRLGDIGLEEKDLAGHTLRAGFATSAIQAGANPLDVQRHTGHASLDMLRVYIRDGSLFRGNPTSKLGL